MSNRYLTALFAAAFLMTGGVVNAVDMMSDTIDKLKSTTGDIICL